MRIGAFFDSIILVVKRESMFKFGNREKFQISWVNVRDSFEIDSRSFRDRKPIAERIWDFLSGQTGD
jgi:hypothetical protein